MKRISSILLLISVMVWVTGGCGSKDKGTTAEDARKETKAAVHFISMKIANEPIVAFRFVFHTGSMNDPGGKNGLANLTARLIADGGTQKNSYQDIIKKLFPIASSYTVQVDREYTTFSGRTHVDNVDLFYSLFKEALLEPGFRAEDFKRLKSQAINTIKNTLRYNSDEELGKAVFKSFAYRGTPYQKSVRGKVSDLETLTIEDVKSFYKNHFGRNNLVVGISGNYPDMLKDKVTADFSALPDVSVTRQPVKPEGFKGLQVEIVEKKGDSTGIHIGFPINLMRKDADFHALFLANSWLGEHRNSWSHLYQVIREKRGMNYGDYSYIEDFPNGGRRQFPPANIYKNPQLFEIWIRPVENDKRLFALRAALRELKKLADNGLTAEEFETVKKAMSKYCLHFASTNAARLGYKIDDGIYGLKESHLENFKKNIDALTLEQVNAAIKKHLQYENVKIVFVTTDAETLKNDLINNNPSPITYRSPQKEEILKEDKLIQALPLKVLPGNVTIIPVDKVFE